jgi:tRNA(adenine34) deaminase
MMTDFELMGAALEEARKAAALGEVPVGAVVARNGEIIAAAHNTRETEKNALHHAELLAIDAACKALGGWRLWECELFVTLEPCPMCAGAIINSRVRRVVYGAADAKAGCCGSVTDLFAMHFNHHPKVESGLRAEEAQALLQTFFQELRVRLVPCTTIAGHCVLPAVPVQALRTSKGSAAGILAAFCRPETQQPWTALLGSELAVQLGIR